MHDSHTVYAEKSLEMAGDYPMHFAAWLVLEAIQNRAGALQDKITARLREFDRRALAR